MLFTFGFCGVGQIVDLFLLPDALNQANNSNAKTNTTFTQQPDPSNKNGAASTLNEDVDLAELLKNARDAVNRTDKL